MNALLRTTIHSLWLGSTRASCGRIRSGPLDIVHSYAFGFLHSVRPATAASRRPRYAHS